MVIGYFAVNLGIGFFYYRRASGSVNEYFISCRNVPWWLAGTSMVATTFAADTPLAVTGMVPPKEASPQIGSGGCCRSAA